MDQNFISTYVRYYQFKKDEDFWAWQKVDELVHDQPDEGWKVVLSLIDYMDNEDLLSYVAAGPLEDLLSLHGEKIIAQVEEETKSNPRLRIALSHVWQNTMSDDIWKRIQTQRL